MFTFLRFGHRGSDCALLSYPMLFGRSATGNWSPIATEYQPTDPVSSHPWTGLSTSMPGNPDLLLRLQVISPSAYADSTCPGPETPAQHFSALHLELRSGAGIDLDVSFDVSGCTTAMTRFGYDSADALGPN
jgi:hypothetical protein